MKCFFSDREIFIEIPTELIAEMYLGKLMLAHFVRK
jgi:hypothetical protein